MSPDDPTGANSYLPTSIAPPLMARTPSQPSSIGDARGGPVAAVMFAARQMGATEAHLVKYATSGDMWSDKSQVVGYAAVVLTKP